MGLVVRKTVFGGWGGGGGGGGGEGVSTKSVSNQSPQLETSLKIEISPAASLHMILSKKQKKGADQTARMRRLVCACVVHKPPKTGFLEWRPILWLYL